MKYARALIESGPAQAKPAAAAQHLHPLSVSRVCVAWQGKQTFQLLLFVQEIHGDA